MRLTKRKRKIFKIIVAIATLALVLTSILPLIYTSF